MIDHYERILKPCRCIRNWVMSRKGLLENAFPFMELQLVYKETCCSTIENRNNFYANER